MDDLELGSTKLMTIQRVNGQMNASISDLLSVEEPLEIRIVYGMETARLQKNISVTMRTPGNDFELAIGFLFTEGIISSYGDVKNVYHTDMKCISQKQNIVVVELMEGFVPKLMQADRNFYTTSSCGVCGKGSVESIRTVTSFHKIDRPKVKVSADILYQLPDKLREAQGNFSATGGIHASGLFNSKGELIELREDVGRHNALDKLIGGIMMGNLLPLEQHIFLLSGRASFELIQKAAMAGGSIVAAIGAPSSLAVDLANEFDITLIGFLKEDRFNIYNAGERIAIPTTVESSFKSNSLRY